MKKFVRSNWSVFLLLSIMFIVLISQNVLGFVRNKTVMEPLVHEVIYPQDLEAFKDYQIEQVQIPLYAHQVVTKTFFQDGVLYYTVANNWIQQKYASSHEVYSYENQPKKIFTIEKEFPYILEVYSVVEDSIVYSTTDTRNFHRLYIREGETQEEIFIAEWSGEESFDVVSHGGLITLLKDGVPTFFDMRGKPFSYKKSNLLENILQRIWATPEALAFSYEDPKGSWVKAYSPQERNITIVPVEGDVQKLRYTEGYLCWTAEKNQKVFVYHLEEGTLKEYVFLEPFSESNIVYPHQAQILLQGKEKSLYLIQTGKDPIKIEIPQGVARGTLIYYVDTIRTLRLISFL